MPIYKNQKELLELILLKEKLKETKEISDRLDELKALQYISGSLLPCDGPNYEWSALGITQIGRRALADYCAYEESMKPLNRLKSWGGSTTSKFFATMTDKILVSLVGGWGLIFIIFDHIK